MDKDNFEVVQNMCDIYFKWIPPDEIVSVNGRIDARNSDKKFEALKMNVDAGKLRLVVDMADVSTISRWGLDVLVGLSKRCRRYNVRDLSDLGNLVVADPSDNAFIRMTRDDYIRKLNGEVIGGGLLDVFIPLKRE